MFKITALISLAALPAVAAAADYQASLGPMPLDDETKAFIAGRGQATASYEGRMLTVKGSFGGLPSPATKAWLYQSPHIGVPGTQVLELKVTPATSGEVSGAFQLTGSQAAALRTGNLYVQINSEKAPPGYSWGPRGTLWGWLLPAHEVADAGVPQQGDWFIPQLKTPKR